MSATELAPGRDAVALFICVFLLFIYNVTHASSTRKTGGEGPERSPQGSRLEQVARHNGDACARTLLPLEVEMVLLMITQREMNED